MFRLDKLRRRAGLRLPKPRSLRRRLVSEGRTDWVDLGSVSFPEGFVCVGLKDPEEIDAANRDRYVRCDLINADDDELDRLGRFDLVRMQHAFEHFSFEEGRIVLRRCVRLLKPGGHLLITVPDLRVHVAEYLSGYGGLHQFRKMARGRIPEDAPPSFYFSIHAHQYGYAPGSHPGNAHRWLYDHEGLLYQIGATEGLVDARPLSLLNPLAEFPFTHNRPWEDACVLARRAPD